MKTLYVYVKEYFQNVPKWHSWVAVTVAVVLLLILASNFAEPSNPLYPVKVYFTEKIGSLFAFTERQQAGRARELSDRRLGEAARLLLGLQLDKDKMTTLRDLLMADIAKGRAVIDLMSKNNNTSAAADLANRFEADLLGYEVIFLKLRKEHDGALDQVDSIGASLAEEISKIQKMRSALETSLSASGNATLLKNQIGNTSVDVKNLVSKARRIISDNKLTLGDNIAQLSESRLRSTESVLLEAEGKEKNELYGEAFMLVNQAYREAEAEIIFLGFMSEFSA